VRELQSYFTDNTERYGPGEGGMNSNRVQIFLDTVHGEPRHKPATISLQNPENPKKLPAYSEVDLNGCEEMEFPEPDNSSELEVTPSLA
jgi:hypothetical protein